MQRDLPRQRGAAAGFTFETTLENETEILDGMLAALVRNQLPPEAWSALHLAAVRDDKLAEVAEAYASVVQGRRIKTAVPAVVAEVHFQAGVFFADALSDALGAIEYWKRALAASPGHAQAFARLESALIDAGERRAQADLYIAQAHQRPRAEQPDLLRRAVLLLEQEPDATAALIEQYQEILRLDPRDEETRSKLEAAYVAANRPRDVARLLEQALTSDPPPDEVTARDVRSRLVHLYAGPLNELERSLPHVENLLAEDPEHEEARAVAQRLLDVKAFAARAAAALSVATEATGTPADIARILAVELEHTRGPKRREVLRRLGFLRQDRLGEEAGAYEAFEQALALDPTDDEVLTRYVSLAASLGKEVDAARSLARFGAATKDAAARARISAEVGSLYLAGGDTKRARASFVAVLALPDLPPAVTLQVSRSLCGIYAAERDFRSLADCLERVALLEPDDDLRQTANEELAELAQGTLRDAGRAIAAWRRLVDTPARQRALAALEPLYSATGSAVDLAFILEERSKDEPDPEAARTLAFRAAEVLTAKAPDKKQASDAWARYAARFGADREALRRWIPILEEEQDWARLSQALEADASQASDDERAALWVKLGQIRLQRTADVPGAILAFAHALAADPGDAVSRAALERLAAAGAERLAAARVLEPYYRAEEHVAGVLRVLDLKATASPDATERAAAIDEALSLLEGAETAKVVEWLARGLREAVAARGDIGGWADRLEAAFGAGDRKRAATMLTRALADVEIDADPLVDLATRAAEAHVASGDVGAALALYRRALVFDPGAEGLIARIDELLQQQGTPAERIALYRAALEKGPDPRRRRELLHTIAQIERRDQKDSAAAIATYETAVADEASDRDARTALAELYAEARRWDALHELLDRSLSVASPEEAPSVHARMAEVAVLRNDYAGAREHADAVLGGDAADDAAVAPLEAVARTLGDTAMLRAVLARRGALAADPAARVTWLDRLAELELSSSAPELAVATWKRAAALAETLADAATAQRLYQRVRDVSPDDREAVAKLADLLEQAGSFAELPELYAILLAQAEAPSARVAVLMRHARLLAEHTDDLPSALVAAAQAFELASASSEYRDVLSMFTMLALRGKATHIFAHAMDEAIARNSGHDPEEAGRRTDLRMAKARVLAANREGRDAAVLAYRAILDDADVGEAQTKSALHAFDSLLASDAEGVRRADRRWLFAWRAERGAEGDRARALEAWAQAEENLFAEPKEALELYRRALAIEPENVRVLSAVARLALGMGDAEGAVAALTAQRDRSEGPARIALELELATTYLHRLGKPDEALAAVSRVLEGSPDDEAALRVAGQLLAHDATKSRMAEVLDKAQRESADAAVRGQILRALLDGAPAASPPETRREWFDALFDLLREQGDAAGALDTTLAAVLEQPAVPAFWDRAEELARELEKPAAVGDAYAKALGEPVSVETATFLGERGVSFQEEWFEDSSGVVRILERVLEIDPAAEWAFGRLKMIFDSGERWPELFALYDRAIERADDAQKAVLFEDAAQIAKDFANDSERAIRYLEQLLVLRPSDAHLVASLERLYERKGATRELVGLLGKQVAWQKGEGALRTRARIARLWLDDLSDLDRALAAAEELRTAAGSNEASVAEALGLLEKIMAAAPREAPQEGEADKPVRYRAAAILRAEYGRAARDADLVRLFEVELEIATSPEERVSGHRQIATFYAKLGDPTAALEHVATLALLEPEVAAHRAELGELAEKVGRYDRLADVLVKVSDKTKGATLRAELLTQAGDVWATRLSDDDKAIGAYLSVVGGADVPPALALDAARKVEPLLEKVNRAWDLLDVLERLATLEQESDVRGRAWTLAARLATSLGDGNRAVAAWESRLKEGDDDEALDAMVDLLERASRWTELISALGRRAKARRPVEARLTDRVRVARVLCDRLDDTEGATREWTAIEADFGPSDESTDALCELLEKTGRWAPLEAKLADAAGRAPTAARRAELHAHLGDVIRLHAGDARRAVTSYEAALAASPLEGRARKGLAAIAESGSHVPAVVRALLAAYEETDDWRETVALTELRLSAAGGEDERVAVLKESAKLADERGEDRDRAFELIAEAFRMAPARAELEAELTRLAGVTHRWARLVEVAEEALANPPDGAATSFEDPAWRAAYRFRLGQVKDRELEDAAGALTEYVASSEGAPRDLAAALAIIDVAGRLGRWDDAAVALVRVCRATGASVPEAVAALEAAAESARAWDAATAEVIRAVSESRDLPPAVARDLEAKAGEWHEDRRGDPDAAEAAYARALAHDPESATLLEALAKLQRRSKGRPLVDSLLRLSATTGGDLELLREAADVALESLSDRGLARTILKSLMNLAEARWAKASTPDDASDDAPVSVGVPLSPAPVARWAITALRSIHESDGQPERTIELLEAAAKLPWSREESREMRSDAARIARDEVKDEARAIAIYEGLVADGPDDRAAASALTALYEETHKDKELLALRARLVERAGTAEERIALRLASSKIEVALERDDAAQKLLAANLVDSGRHGETVDALVALWSRTSKFADLVDLHVKQGDLADGDGETRVAADEWLRAADITERNLGDAERAIRYYRRAVPYDQGPRSLDPLARLLAASGDHVGAAEALRALLPVEGGRSTALVLRYASELAASGDVAGARSELEAAAKASPDDRSLSDRLVQLYTEHEAWDALAGLHRDAADRATDKVSKLAHLRAAADLLIRKCGTPEAAISLLELASGLDPEDRATKLVLADALVHAARFAEARTLLRSVVDSFGGRRPKERGVAHYHLALLEMATDNRKAALAELDAATKIDPSNIRILRALAELALADGQVDRAERSYRALLVALRRPEESSEDAEVVRSEVLLALSGIAAGQGQADRARELVESALETAAKSLVEARRLEKGLREQKDFPTLVRALEARLARADGDEQRVEVLTELGRVLDVELGHLVAAFEARQNILALTPLNAKAHEASQALARRVDGSSRYVADTERLATIEDAAGRAESAAALYAWAAQAVEVDLKDDPRAAALQEKSLDVLLRATPPDAPPTSSAARRAVTAIRALDPIYLRLGKGEDRLRLLTRRVALEDAQGDAKTSADARYRLAELTFQAPEGRLEAGLLVTQALELDHDLERAEGVVRVGLGQHEGDEGLLDLLETIGRNPGHEAALLDALAARSKLPGASPDVVREAAGLAKQLGDTGRAEALLTSFVERSDDHEVGWAFEELAGLREAGGDSRAAVEWKRRAADVSESSEARRLRFEMAKLTADALGDLAGAATLYEQLFDDDPADSAASEPMLAAYRRLGDAKSLVRVLARVMDHATSDEERSALRLERARLAVDALGDRAGAMEQLAELVADEPNNAAAGELLASLYEQAGKKEELTELVGRQIDAAKDRQDAAKIEALSLRRAALALPDDPDEARATLNSALDWVPESKSVLKELARLLDGPGFEDERLEVKERLLKVADAPEAEAAALGLADLRAAAGDAEAAERALEIGFRVNPKSAALSARLEEGYRARGATDKLAGLKVAEARAIEDPVARVARLREVAKLYSEGGAHGEAVGVLDEAFALARGDSSVATDLATALVQARELRRATEVLGQALDVIKDDPARRAKLLLERASLFVELGDDAAAAADLVSVARLGVINVTETLDAELERVRARAEARGDGPIERTMRIELAAVRAEAGDLDGARPLVTELLRREPKDRDALRLLARIEERAERWDAATVAYRRLIPLEEGDLAVDTALRLADACERAGRLADARGALERTRTAAPNDQALRLRLERLYESVGAFRELAEMSFTDAREAPDDAARFGHLKRAGSLLLQDGTDTDAAIDALVDAHALSTGDIECTLLLADAYTVAGKTAEASALISGQIEARAGRRSPEMASLYHRLARVSHVLDDRAGELSALLSALEADAQNGFVAAELAALGLETGDMEIATRALRAVTLLKDASTSQIPKALAYQYLGEIARQQGDPKRALLLFKRAIEDDPTLDSARELIEQLRAEGA